MACQPCRRQPSPRGAQLVSCPSPRAWPSPSSQVQARRVASPAPRSAQTRLIPGVRPWYRGTLLHPKLLGPSVRTHPVRDAFQAPPDPDPDTDPGLMHLLHSSSIPAVSTDPTQAAPITALALSQGDPKGPPWPGPARQEREWGAIPEAGLPSSGWRTRGRDRLIQGPLDGRALMHRDGWAALAPALEAGLLGATC